MARRRKNWRVDQRTRLRAYRCKLRSIKHRRGHRACCRELWRIMDRAEVQCHFRVTYGGTHEFKPGGDVRGTTCSRAIQRHSSDLDVKKVVLSMAPLNRDTVN